MGMTGNKIYLEDLDIYHIEEGPLKLAVFLH